MICPSKWWWSAKLPEAKFQAHNIAWPSGFVWICGVPPNLTLDQNVLHPNCHILVIPHFWTNPYIYIYTVCIYIYMQYVYIYIQYVYIYIYMQYVYIYIYSMCIYIYMQYVYIYMCVCMYILIYLYTYISHCLMVAFPDGSIRRRPSDHWDLLPTQGWRRKDTERPSWTSVGSGRIFRGARLNNVTPKWD